MTMIHMHDEDPLSDVIRNLGRMTGPDRARDLVLAAARMLEHAAFEIAADCKPDLVSRLILIAAELQYVSGHNVPFRPKVI